MSWDDTYLPRQLERTVSDALSWARVVIIDGARQVGKTTLVRKSPAFAHTTRVSLDDEATLQVALEDPVGLVEGAGSALVIDEFQRAGAALVRAVKRRVDRDNRPGQFVLTGSANYLASKHAVETLAGRALRATLWPLSVGEIIGTTPAFVERALGGWRPSDVPAASRSETMERLLVGGYPTAVFAPSPAARAAWHRAYLGDVASREALRGVAVIRKEPALRAMFRLLSARTSAELVVADIARDSGLDRATAAEYIALLEALHLVHVLPAWSTSQSTRARRHPKVHVVDTGLAASVLGLGADRLAAASPDRALGSLLESFVVAELAKQRSWSGRPYELYHLREHRGDEIDVVAEDEATGRVVAIEVKATSTPRYEHARGIRRLAERIGDRFAGGFVLHLGEQRLDLGGGVSIAPISDLWVAG